MTTKQKYDERKRLRLENDLRTGERRKANFNCEDEIEIISLKFFTEQGECIAQKKHMHVIWAAEELINDWKNGDFYLSPLATLDMTYLDEALTDLFDALAAQEAAR